jgi:hypothetical protein
MRLRVLGNMPLGCPSSYLITGIDTEGTMLHGLSSSFHTLVLGTVL